MDIFAHGLWAGAAAKGLNKREGRPRVNVWAMALWGVFPDLLAFTLPFIFIMWGLVFGGLDFSQFSSHHPPLAEPAGSTAASIFGMTSVLYTFGHSAVVFVVVFFATWAFFKRPRLEMLGWLIHILLDVPTHTYAFYPTPVFWPLWGWEFNGFSWGVPWFMVLNYSLILLAYALLSRKKKSFDSRIA